MAWRKPMVTVRDDPEALAAAACKKSAGRANCSRIFYSFVAGR